MSRLYLLDNQGHSKAGSCYPGNCDNWFPHEQICELVQKLKEEHGYEQIITLGSSKGGTAAVYYACLLRANAAIAGAPRYYIGKYLNKAHLHGITRSSDKASVARLDQLVREQLILHQNDQRKQKIYPHYSPQEATYQNQIADLHILHFEVEEDCGYQYAAHSEVERCFIPYFQKICRTLSSSQKNV